MNWKNKFHVFSSELLQKSSAELLPIFSTLDVAGWHVEMFSINKLEWRFL